VAVKATRKHGLGARLRDLRAGGLVEVTDREDRMLVYQAVTAK
jgi:hypothetical protein